MKVGGVALLLSAALLAVNGESAGPCCQTCEPGKEHYFSIPHPGQDSSQCGECCLNPSHYSFWKLFEPKLLKGDCASQGFTKYTGTESDGVWPASVTSDRYVQAHGILEKGSQVGGTLVKSCPDNLRAVFADMHDGDKKEVTISGTSMTIKPAGNNQTWVIRTTVDSKSCSAVVDFNVPGKPGPPPVNLTATLWYSVAAPTGARKTEFEFTDPSGTLAEKSLPLNRWVELVKGKDDHRYCQEYLNGVFADIHDGDKKEVTISNSSMTIRPNGNNQTWIVTAPVDPESCSARINFNVSGKPNPPHVTLLATLHFTLSPSLGMKHELEFTDPSGTLAATDFPLNTWIQIENTITQHLLI